MAEERFSTTPQRLEVVMSENEQNSNPGPQTSMNMMLPVYVVLLGVVVLVGFGLLYYSFLQTDLQGAEVESVSAVDEDPLFVLWQTDDWVVVPDGYEVSWHTYNEWVAQPDEARDECGLFYDALRRYVNEAWIDKHRPEGFCANAPRQIRQCIFLFDRDLSRIVYCGGPNAWRFANNRSGLTIDEEISLALDELFNQKYIRTQ